MTEQEAEKLQVQTEWNGKANVCVHCGRVPERFYVATGHDHTDYDIAWCPCRGSANHGAAVADTFNLQRIEQLTAELEAAKTEIKHITRSRDNFAANAENSLHHLDVARSEIDRLKSGWESDIRHIDTQAKKLAARDLVIQKMREALVSAKNTIWHLSHGVNEKVVEALTLQPTTEALDAYVNARLDEMSQAAYPSLYKESK
jgi:primase-polymerase (primpol)-like protein